MDGQDALTAACIDLARRCRRLGVDYMISGGANAALQVPVPIDTRDIDLMTDQEGAYRLGEDLAADAEVLRPVSLGEGERFRSHFGRFRLGEVGVDVMGELQRKVGDEWEPSTPLEQRVTIHIRGTSVSVVPLHIEVGSYVLRQHERVPKLLPHCDIDAVADYLRDYTHLPHVRAFLREHADSGTGV